MNNSQLFNRTRWQLAGWYAGVMGVILGLSGITVYSVISHSEWQALHRELESVAGTLHDSLEPKLKQPGKIEDSVKQALPGLCVTDSHCTDPDSITKRHILGVVQKDSYYLRLLTQTGASVATLGEQPNISNTPFSTEPWQTLEPSQGLRYHQFSLLLKTEHGAPWGYLQIGRSLEEFDQHLSALKLCLMIGLPLVMILISGASWWLARLAMQPIYQAYQQIQQFTADAAHELRTPLAAIRATIEASLRSENLSNFEARNTLQTLERQSGRLSQLVQDLLLLSRMDLQPLSVTHQSCCLNDLISDTVEELAALAIAAEVMLKANLPTHAIYISGNEEQLYRLLANLITNAIQHTLAGGTVTVSLDREESYATIQVQDTGIGIASEAQSRIFDRFYRVQSDRSRSTGGSGLGLAISKAIVQAHRGSLTVESQLSQGSVFKIQILCKTKLNRGEKLIATLRGKATRQITTWR